MTDSMKALKIIGVVLAGLFVLGLVADGDKAGKIITPVAPMVNDTPALTPLAGMSNEECGTELDAQTSEMRNLTTRISSLDGTDPSDIYRVVSDWRELSSRVRGTVAECGHYAPSAAREVLALIDGVDTSADQLEDIANGYFS
jgi:hypothetical protein